jgi:uncharacterized membrane protein YqjE
MQPAAPPARKESTAAIALEAIRVVRAVGGDALEHAVLLGSLLQLEWEQELKRLKGLLIAAVIGGVSLFVLVLFAVGLVLAVSWDTPYRVLAVLGLAALFAAGSWAAFRRVSTLSEQGKASFAATREQYAKDLALLKEHL